MAETVNEDDFYHFNREQYEYERSPGYEASRIREKLRHYDGVAFAAYNLEEVREIKKRLTPEEIKRVAFSWIDFTGRTGTT